MHINNGEVIESRAQILTEVRELLFDLQVTFMSLEDFMAAVLKGRLAAKPNLLTGDHPFEEENPAHPLAASRRFVRIGAADRIMNLARCYGKPFPADILKVLHQSLFDCSAAVRHSIAAALFQAGNESSINELARLLEQEQDSPAVRIRAQAAMDRLRGPFAVPKDIPQIVVVLDNLLLVEKLMEMAESQGATVCHARPDSPDIIAFSGNVKIIDHQLLGRKAWKEFCQYLEEVNGEEADAPRIKPVRDDTPLIIVDNQPPGTPPDFKCPLTNGKQYYTPVWNCDEICRLAGEFIEQEVDGDKV